MRKGGSKQKGNEFERLVANSLREELEEFGIDKSDVYRTPLSGGHPYASDADLVISDRLFPVFPFIVECKHEKKLTVGGLFDLRADFRKHLQQVLRATATATANGLKGCSPLLVWQGNRTNIYAATFPSAIIKVYGKSLPETMTRLHFRYDCRTWVMFDWSDFRKLVRSVAERIR